MPQNHTPCVGKARANGARFASALTQAVAARSAHVGYLSATYIEMLKHAEAPTLGKQREEERERETHTRASHSLSIYLSPRTSTCYLLLFYACSSSLSLLLVCWQRVWVHALSLSLPLRPAHSYSNFSRFLRPLLQGPIRQTSRRCG